MCDIIIDTQYGVISDLRIDMMMMVVVLCCSSVVMLVSSSSISFFYYYCSTIMMMICLCCSELSLSVGASSGGPAPAAPVEDSSRLTEVRHRT